MGSLDVHVAELPLDGSVLLCCPLVLPVSQRGREVMQDPSLGLGPGAACLMAQVFAALWSFSV